MFIIDCNFIIILVFEENLLIIKMLFILLDIDYNLLFLWKIVLRSKLFLFLNCSKYMIKLYFYRKYSIFKLNIIIFWERIIDF